MIDVSECLGAVDIHVLILPRQFLEVTATLEEESGKHLASISEHTGTWCEGIWYEHTLGQSVKAMWCECEIFCRLVGPSCWAV